jgi:hypothetical protein
MQKRGKTVKGFWSFKFRSTGLRYEVCLCILTGDIVWVNGPFPCGDWNDLTIFRQALKSELGEAERVEADDGYVGEDPETAKSAGCVLHNPDKKIKMVRQRVRSRQETVNKRLKQFNVVHGCFRHNPMFHGSCFFACAVLTQLSIENFHPLFQVAEYSDQVEDIDAIEEDDDIDGDDFDEDEFMSTLVSMNNR